MVEGKLSGWFDLKSKPRLLDDVFIFSTTLFAGFSWFKWIKEKTIQKFSFMPNSMVDDTSTSGTNIWEEREAAERDIKMYLSDFPSTLQKCT